MSTELALPTQPMLDGFDFDDDDGRDGVGGLLRGTSIKFLESFTWGTQDGRPLPVPTRLLLDDIIEANVRWGEGHPIEITVRTSNDQLPLVDTLNSQIDKKEWREFQGKLEPPWRHEYYCYFRALDTVQVFAYRAANIGGGICVREARKTVKWLREMRGDRGRPIITLSDTHFPNRHSKTRRRPHFVFDINGWVVFGNGGATVEPVALPAPRPKNAEEALHQFAEAGKTETVEKTETSVIKEPKKSLSAGMGGDEVPW